MLGLMHHEPLQLSGSVLGSLGH
uniref:Uncharacterized protein n=1 Tax=Arundo donax TaxID=35708 RepID=A0A0A9EMZ2_ARUDO